MNIETLEKASSLQLEINSINSELCEMQDGSLIQVAKDGKVYMKVNDGWASKAVPDWFAQKINDALYEYWRELTERRDNLITELNEL